MTREIKFRAWSNEHKQMFRVGGFANMDYDASSEHRYVTIAGRDAGTIPDATPQLQTLELMQYTGLKDKNGVEIYEGDIVKEEDDGGTYEVKYFAYDDYPAFDLEPSLDVDSNGLSFLTASTGCEVIGNIYEHGELLDAND